MTNRLRLKSAETFETLLGENWSLKMPTAKRSTVEPYWTSECGRAVVYVGDNRDVLPHLEPKQFHAVVTDPPYGLEFMNKQWDAPWKANGKIEVCDENTDKSHPFRDGTNRIVYGLSDPQGYQAWFLTCAEAMLRVAKPGAHLLSFGGTRMWHRMACAIEDAGWNIRDMILYLYGSGFPKGVNVSKTIDKELRAERSKTRTEWTPECNKFMSGLGVDRPWKDKAKRVGYHEHDGNEPVTEQAQQWDGWNTALKPALEPVILARKPFAGTVAQCVMENATGALNIDACRVGVEGGTTKHPTKGHRGIPGNVLCGSVDGALNGLAGVPNGKGRWPANLIHDGSDEVMDLFPTSSSSSAVSRLPLTPGDSNGEAHGDTDRTTLRGHDDSGSVARFFYTSKAGNDDRPHSKGSVVHPTVKPLDLMQYLVRLVCAPGGTVLDSFMGSGSTGCAAIAEGMRFVGIEQSQEYADIAVGRLKLALAGKPIEETPGEPKTYKQTTAQQTITPSIKKLRGL